MQAEITAFQAKADHLAEQLLQLIERLRQGYAPDQKTVDDLTCAAVELRAMYREIAEKALENVAEADKSDYSVSELARLWEEHNVRHRQEQKQAVLERFLRVSSDEAGFDEALAPYREKVDCLLAELLNNSTDDATIAPYAAFLQVMDLPAEEMDGPNGEAQLEALDGVFAAKVQRGLMRGRYRESLPPLFRQPDTEKVQKFAIQQESSQQDRAEGEKVSAPISTEAQELPRLTPCYPTKTMERAKRCVSDMEKVPGAFTILSLLLRCGALSFSQLCGWGATIASSVEITETKMERLAQMGYVNACMLDGEKLWWLAPSVNALLAKNLVREALYRFGVMHSFSLPGKGSLPFDQGPSGDSLRLHALSTENERLLKYARRIRENMPNFQNLGSAFFEHLFWDGESYHNNLVEEKISCRLCSLAQVATAAPGESVLLICDQLPTTSEVDKCPGELYAYVDCSYHWNQGWQMVVQTADSEAGTSATESGAGCEQEIPVKEQATDFVPEALPAKPAAELESSVKETITDFELAASVVAASDSKPEIPSEESEPVKSVDKSPAPELVTNEKEMDPESVARQLLQNCTGEVIPKDGQLEELVRRLADQNVKCLDPSKPLRDSLAEAVMLAYTAGQDSHYPRCSRLYRQFNAALDTGLSRPERNGDALSQLFFQEKRAQWKGEQALAMAACFQALLFPDKDRDYGLRGLTESAFRDYEKNFPDLQYNELKVLFHELLEGRVKNLAGGFNGSVLRSMMSEEERAEQLDQNQKAAREIQTEARDAFSAVMKSLPRLNGLPEMYKACFGHKSDLYIGLETVIANRTEERAMVEMVLDEYNTSEKLDRYIDEQWKSARAAIGSTMMRLDYTARDKVHAAFKRRLDVMREWMELTEHAESNDAVRSAWSKAVSLIQNCRKALSQDQNPSAGLLNAALERILDHLDGKVLTGQFVVLLSSGWFTLDGTGTPVLERGLCQVRYAEPWRWMLAHLCTARRPIEQVRRDILNRDTELFDNLGQLAAIHRFLGEEEEDDDLPAAERYASQARNSLQDKLELAYTYDRIGGGDKERILNLLERYQPFFYENRDFANWRRFLHALERQVDDADRHGYERLRDRLETYASTAPERLTPLLKKARDFLEKDRNFAVAEEYINRFERGDDEMPLEDQYCADYYADFLRFAPDCFTKCQRNQRNSSSLGKGWGWSDIVHPRLPQTWSKNNLDKSAAMLRNWITAKGSDSPVRISSLVTALGFNVVDQEVMALPDNLRRDGSCSLFRLSVKPSPKNSSDGFAHPIAAFGTRMAPILPVLCVYGGKTSRQLVDLACGCNLDEPFLLLANYPLSEQSRREISEYFHTEKNVNQKPFLVVDQVMILFLATLEENQRLPALLQCTLPYTVYQPFNGENGSTPDEMFCGRVQELARIRDGSAKLVYGGRQLGKTALLQRTASLKHDPRNKRFALFVDIQEFREERDVLEKIVTRAKEQQVPLVPCSSFSELCNQIRQQLSAGGMREFHLLIDEVDRFMQAISSQRYRPLKPLVELNREDSRFKFTLAGLHNVRRAFQSVDDPNSIFGQMGQPLCVKPLSPADALRLLTRPLQYLGLRFGETTHMETILTKTNYYPGILQFSGYTLASTLATHYHSYYNSQNNPPFPLTREQLASIINDTKLNPLIKEKIRLTLRLDPRYHMLARCIAVLCHLEPEEDGYSLDQIRRMAEEFCHIQCLVGLSREEYRALLDELEGMGILLHQEKRDTYSFLRRSFLEVIGPDLDRLYEEIQQADQADQDGGNVE